ncbi:MAG: hypothetical protein WCK51_10990 [Armatimonadota bacterium]
MKPLPRLTKDDVERLSRGEATRSRAGSRGVGHRLTVRERALFEAAKKQGFLKIPVTGARENVRNVYRKWCEATGQTAVILESDER